MCIFFPTYFPRRGGEVPWLRSTYFGKEVGGIFGFEINSFNFSNNEKNSFLCYCSRKSRLTAKVNVILTSYNRIILGGGSKFNDLEILERLLYGMQNPFLKKCELVCMWKWHLKIGLLVPDSINNYLFLINIL